MSKRTFTREQIAPLSPLNIATYLQQKGWQREDAFAGDASYWRMKTDRGLCEVLVPFNIKYGDYALRLAEAVALIANVEQRPPEQVLSDLLMGSSDLFRLRVSSPAAQDGTLPLELGVHLIEHAQGLMSAAACSALRPAAQIPSRRPNEAQEYLRGLRLGQTEKGSFVLTIQSPIPPQLSGQLSLLPDLEQPFARRVTMALAKGLEAVSFAVTRTLSTSSVVHFSEFIVSGLSANLCDAIAGLISETGAERLELGLTWSTVRPAPRDLPTKFTFDRSVPDILREGSRWLRETSPRNDFELSGLVTALRRDDVQGPGLVTVTGLVDGSLRKVQVSLEGQDYDFAVRAHKDFLPVRMEGELVRESRAMLLRNARSIGLESDA